MVGDFDHHLGDLPRDGRRLVAFLGGTIGNLGRNAIHGPTLSQFDLTAQKRFPIHEQVNLEFRAEIYNLFNHANFGLPILGYAGIPGNRSTQTGFGALTYTTAPPTGLLGVGLGGDSSPRMIAFQARLEF